MNSGKVATDGAVRFHNYSQLEVGGLDSIYK